MDSEFSPLPPDLLQTDRGLAILRFAALLAEGDGEPDDDALDSMFDQVEVGLLDVAAPTDVWSELRRGLMARSPSIMIRALRECGALSKVLPEAARLFGVPQIADDPPEVDLGEHLLHVLDETAKCEAPLEVRFAALVMNAGKFDSPREHLPVHYRHIERGAPRIEAICKRFGVPDECKDLALLALSECERVHRASEIRAGPIAAMLERLDAFDQPERFALFMMLCTCDYRAYGNRDGKDYPKAALLNKAVAACNAIDAEDLELGSTEAEAEEAWQTARAMAIAEAFRSERWA